MKCIWPQKMKLAVDCRIQKIIYGGEMPILFHLIKSQMVRIVIGVVEMVGSMLLWSGYWMFYQKIISTEKNISIRLKRCRLL